MPYIGELAISGRADTEETANVFPLGGKMCDIYFS